MLPYAYRLRFELASSTLNAEFDDAWSARLASTAFSPLLCRPGSKHHTGSVCIDGDRLVVRFDRRQTTFPANPDAFGAAYVAVRELFARFAAAATNNMAFFGALCAVNGGAVAIIGPSGIGKTLLTLHLVATGAVFCGDETFLVREGGLIAALPRLPALRESALPLLPSRLRESVRESPNAVDRSYGRFWYALQPSDLCGISPDATTRSLRAVVVLHGRAADARVEPLERDVLLREFVRRAYIRTPDFKQLAEVSRLLSGVPGFSVVSGSPAQTASRIVAELHRV